MSAESRTPTKPERKWRTNREWAQLSWEREGWGEPRDEEQERLWIAFFTDDIDGGARYWPRSWQRPREWVEELVRR